MTVGGEGQAAEEVTLGDVSEQAFGELGRARPEVMRALLAAQDADAEGWGAFQSAARQLKLQRSRWAAAPADLAAGRSAGARARSAAAAGGPAGPAGRRPGARSHRRSVAAPGPAAHAVSAQPPAPLPPPSLRAGPSRSCAR